MNKKIQRIYKRNKCIFGGFIQRWPQVKKRKASNYEN